MGIEALSRGARHATFVELDRDALRAIRENLELTRLMDRATVARDEVFKFIRRHSVTPALTGGARVASPEGAKQSPTQHKEIATSRNPSTSSSTRFARAESAQEALLAMTRYDLIYVAPPQYRELWLETLKTIDGRGFLSERGIVIAQIHPKEFSAHEFAEFELSDQRKYGSTLLCFYRRKVSAART